MKRLSWRESQLKQQAQFWKMEARSANHTLGHIYQICTGATGEPGNWNGSEPVRAMAAERDALRAQVEAERLKPIEE